MSKPNTLQKFLVGAHRMEGLIRLVLFFVAPIVIPILLRYIFGFSSFTTLITNSTILYFLGLIGAMASTAYYIRDIYQTETEAFPFRYLMASFFGLGAPRVSIKSETPESKWWDMVEKIGGPAYLDIDPGFAVLTETLSETANVFGHGKKHFMPNHERIYEIVDLREQEGSIPELAFATRDGIKVRVENIKFNYRIWDSRWEGLYKDQTISRNPFPYSKKAIHDYSYNRAVQVGKGDQYQLTPWFDAVKGRMTGIIKDYINEHKLEDVIGPREQNVKDARQEIRENAYKPGFKDGLRSIGTILRWWDPGDFKSEEKSVEERFVSNWSVDIMSNVVLNDAHGDAQKQAYEELGRAEAEAELLTSIIHALEGVNLGKNKAQTFHNLILMRTAQVIRALNTPAVNDHAYKPSDQQSSNDEHKLT